MKKNLVYLVATAAIVTGCSNTDSFKEVTTPDLAIGFSTYTNVATKGENSSATDKTATLEAYNTTFKVWGNKYVNGSPSVVFNGQVVEHKEQSTNPDVAEGWYYEPIRFWDKTATSYDFYAAAPANQAWGWDATNKKLSLSNFTVSGSNTVETPATTVNAKKVMAAVNTEDLMISTDVTGYNKYLATPVNLDFNHILSRLNIGVRKSADLDAFIVKLNSIKVFNMVKKGTFTENTVITPDNTEDDEAALLAAGTVARWTPTSDKFTDGEMQFTTVTTITSTASDNTTNYQYVYEGLIIPQTVGYKQTVSVDEYTKANETAQANMFKLDGSNKSASSEPYILIDYEIGVNVNNEYSKIDGYKYYYNLADVFNGENSESPIDFCEGWQNTLKITLAPVAINFDADVYEWSNKVQATQTVE
jgi:hypothetical protein